MIKQRDVNAVRAALRKGGPMGHKNAPKGGARNLQAEYMAQADEVAHIEEIVEADACMAGEPCDLCS
jgi:hypothetical protein